MACLRGWVRAGEAMTAADGGEGIADAQLETIRTAGVSWCSEQLFERLMAELVERRAVFIGLDEAESGMLCTLVDIWLQGKPAWEQRVEVAKVCELRQRLDGAFRRDDR